MVVLNPKERTVDLTAVGEPLAELVEQATEAGQRVVVERDGLPIAAIVTPLDLEWLKRHDAERAEAIAVLEEFAAAFADVDPDELQREVDKAVAEARAELRAERDTSKRP